MNASEPNASVEAHPSLADIAQSELRTDDLSLKTNLIVLGQITAAPDCALFQKFGLSFARIDEEQLVGIG